MAIIAPAERWRNRALRAVLGVVMTTAAHRVGSFGVFAVPAPPTAAAQVGPPDTLQFPSGNLRLRGLLWKPRGNGPFPAVLFHHGSGRSYEREMAALGPVYASHGYVFFVPFRRGQGLSSDRGPYIGTMIDDERRLHGDSAWAQMIVDQLSGPHFDDVVAARVFLAGRPFVDRRRIAVAGNSFGGIMTMITVERDTGFRAALDFAGAAQTWKEAPQVRALMLHAATNARVPVFFGQAENDYDLTPSRALGAAMTAAKKPNTVRIFPAFGSTTAEGHSFGYFGGAIWAPDVFAFLAEHLR